MDGLKELYRIGHGPSSSHALGPGRAAVMFRERHPRVARYRVTLFGSLAATGKGHLTDRAIEEALGADRLALIWRPEEQLPHHPNGLRFEALTDTGAVLGTWETYSVGGGAIEDAPQDRRQRQLYPVQTMSGALELCEGNGQSLWELVGDVEGDGIWVFLGGVWDAMSGAIDRGLAARGRLPGELGLPRKAWSLHRKATMFGPHLRQDGLLAAYAYAVSEENAAAGIVVTAPTCGASGVVPSVLRYLHETLDCSRQDVVRALAAAGLVGNLVKSNASISGAEVGCQGEVGTACAMAAAAATQLCGGTIRQIEYAAEMGLEHHLGLTCDPVGGLVQIPCIERNAHAAARAVSCCNFALLSDGTHKIPFDEVVAVLDETGHSLPSLYRETALGGLAKAYRERDVPPGGQSESV